jgi:EAL domain-containing protein (putative c-di-GMP-specific phosphodiesterase class I)
VLALGCTTGQGFFISRPVPGEQLAIWLRARSQHAALAHSRA